MEPILIGACAKVEKLVRPRIKRHKQNRMKTPLFITNLLYV
jgi:hypothetical protein